jgi:hypothetical protein
VALQAVDRQGGGESGRADDHGLSGREAGGQGQGQTGREPGIGGEPPVPGHAQVVAVGQDFGPYGQRRIGTGHHHPGQVHPGDEGGDPGHPVAGDRGQGVFVVDR